ncbi:hypothetical protein ABDK56_06820 [Sphingomonas sp. ASV193]|uniref:hypothetical protein n=1 Tax=Sphingomonas sp. ASV193 TaxID=3144405 RepID=UPI0032E875D0
MTVRRFVTVGMMAALSLPPLATAGPPPLLEPTSPWVVDYADNSCRLIRGFGQGKAYLRLVVEQVEPHGARSIMLIGPGVHSNNMVSSIPPVFRLGQEPPRTAPNTLTFDPLGVRLPFGEADKGNEDGTQAVYWFNRFGHGRYGLLTPAQQKAQMEADVANGYPGMTKADLSDRGRDFAATDWSVPPAPRREANDALFDARAAKVTSVRFDGLWTSPVSLNTGPLDKPLQTLEKCTTDSLPDWGIDPAVEASIAVRAHPAAQPSRFFTSEDYPTAALRAMKESRMTTWLNIDATGKIAKCRVISAFASPEINDAICLMVRRKVRYVPAQRADGTKVADYDVLTFSFVV